MFASSCIYLCKKSLLSLLILMQNADDGKRSRRSTKRVSYAETRIPEVDSEDEDDKRRSYGSNVVGEHIYIEYVSASY
jgi:hypothetical protein